MCDRECSVLLSQETAEGSYKVARKRAVFESACSEVNRYSEAGVVRRVK